MQQDYLQIRVLELAPQVFASGPLFESDLELLSKQGVRSILNTRPDNESEGQPLAADLAKAAENLGMTFVHFPVDSTAIDKDLAEAFMAASEALERPLIVCGRSGPQTTKIWETAEAF